MLFPAPNSGAQAEAVPTLHAVDDVRHAVHEAQAIIVNRLGHLVHVEFAGADGQHAILLSCAQQPEQPDRAPSGAARALCCPPRWRVHAHALDLCTGARHYYCIVCPPPCFRREARGIRHAEGEEEEEGEALRAQVREGTFPTSSPRGAVLRIRSEHSVSNLQSALTSITIRIPNARA